MPFLKKQTPVARMLEQPSIRCAADCMYECAACPEVQPVAPVGDAAAQSAPELPAAAVVWLQSQCIEQAGANAAMQGGCHPFQDSCVQE